MYVSERMGTHPFTYKALLPLLKVSNVYIRLTKFSSSLVTALERIRTSTLKAIDFESIVSTLSPPRLSFTTLQKFCMTSFLLTKVF